MQTIDMRTNPIDVINSDGVLITGNSLTYASERGRGIVIDFDSDNNQIVRNTVTSTDAASTGQVHQLPGGPFVTGSAIMDNKIHILQGDKELQNFVVSGVLIQVPAACGTRISRNIPFIQQSRPVEQYCRSWRGPELHPRSQYQLPG